MFCFVTLYFHVQFYDMKADLSDVSISVGDSQISSSPKVHDLGVKFDTCLSLDAHISNICRSTHFHLKETSYGLEFVNFSCHCST